MIGVDVMALFGSVRDFYGTGEERLDLAVPLEFPIIGLPNPEDAEASAKWLASPPDPLALEPYDIVIVAIPKSAKTRESWNAALAMNGFVALSDRYYDELNDPATGWPNVLGPEFTRVESDLWELRY